LSPADGRGASFHELDRRAVVLTMAAVLTAIFMGSLDSTIIATALPAITAALHGFSSYSGVISAYFIASTVALPLGGKLSDVYGRKRLLAIGILWFTLASLLCGAAQSMIQLILFRAIQGLGAGVMQAAATTTIADLYPPAHRGRAIGFLASTSVLASIIGPVLGGFLADGPGWRYVFLINLPVGLLGSFLVARHFPHVRQQAPKDFKIDYLGALCLTAAVVPMLLALHHTGETGHWDGASLSLFALGLVCTALFLFIESRADHPIVPLHIFKNPIISIGLLNTGLSMAAILGVTIFTPLFLQSVLHISAQKSGVILLPLSATFAVFATLSGLLVGRIGRYRNLALAGTAVAIVGTFLLGRVDPATTPLYLLLSAMVAAFGAAVCMPIYNIAVQNAAALNALGVTTSMVYFMRLMASSVGVAVFGSILASQAPLHGLASALSDVFYLATALLVVIFISTLFLKEIPLRRSNRQEPTSP
jgi:EmrB/QacA subfamily drug resistance transporter